jgi:putative FmdB family regulatory protein
MPRYEFLCHECKRLFLKILSLAEYKEGEVACPHCGSKDVEQLWSEFSAIPPRKSA